MDLCIIYYTTEYSQWSNRYTQESFDIFFIEFRQETDTVHGLQTRGVWLAEHVNCCYINTPKVYTKACIMATQIDVTGSAECGNIWERKYSV